MLWLALAAPEWQAAVQEKSEVSSEASSLPLYSAPIGVALFAALIAALGPFMSIEPLPWKPVDARRVPEGADRRAGQVIRVGVRLGIHPVAGLAGAVVRRRPRRDVASPSQFDAWPRGQAGRTADAGHVRPARGRRPPPTRSRRSRGRSRRLGRCR